jgi:AP-2 complex subunit alpha
MALLFAIMAADFGRTLTDPQLSSYQRKKYVAKLIFVYILGYKVDVGHFEAANLVTSNKYTEKQIVCNDSRLQTL